MSRVPAAIQTKTLPPYAGVTLRWVTLQFRHARYCIKIRIPGESRDLLVNGSIAGWVDPGFRLAFARNVNLDALEPMDCE